MSSKNKNLIRTKNEANQPTELEKATFVTKCICRRCGREVSVKKLTGWKALSMTYGFECPYCHTPNSKFSLAGTCMTFAVLAALGVVLKTFGM
ncbi:hypothetical protein ACTQ56_01425 [[Clostridium] aminophilum]|uniref:Uncharacterized protein n=1 Tax=[Clostridium] aminophilum TaxID=1526 RepID=A0A1I0G591_9FIRM|nr:hypothetical protein [[Clostridium] aminophilum]MDD6195714.1 hypothetical protein [[Clostridium] aminophilum]SET65823.1 hypothetical protein SAMN04487771_103028 [[Clostridium] aminophilum]